ncbi:hypothetical protein LCGC14_2013530 [marine sediment metagenome]|uniref:Uncharacterized protein n=1 Tax=marine sediment metagenome TaxID=412755 RepID=A0A0F9EZL0_9ZZZZ
MSDVIIYQGTCETVEKRILNKSSIYESYDLPANSSLNIPRTEEDDSSSQKSLIVESDKFNISGILKNVPKISFDRDIKEEMLENVSFRRYISEIENRLSVFKELYSLFFSVKINFQKDWEIEGLRNIILQLKFYNLLFKEELKFWKKLSIFVREGLQLSEDNLGSKKFIEEFIEYNKAFYIKLDLT